MTGETPTGRGFRPRLAPPRIFLFEERSMAPYSTLTVPPGDRIQSRPDGPLDVPSHPILPFIEGDGTGPDIWRASHAVFDAAVQKAYGGQRPAAWVEGFAGQTAFNR